MTTSTRNLIFCQLYKWIQLKTATLLTKWTCLILIKTKEWTENSTKANLNNCTQLQKFKRAQCITSFTIGLGDKCQWIHMMSRLRKFLVRRAIDRRLEPTSPSTRLSRWSSLLMQEHLMNRPKLTIRKTGCITTTHYFPHETKT